MIELEFVFGTEKSFEKFKELFRKISLQGIFMKNEEEFYYLGKSFFPFVRQLIHCQNFCRSV